MDKGNIQSFMGVPVMISKFMPPDSMWLIPAEVDPRNGPYVAADSMDTVRRKLDEHFLMRCGIVRNLKPE